MLIVFMAVGDVGLAGSWGLIGTATIHAKPFEASQAVWAWAAEATEK